MRIVGLSILALIATVGPALADSNSDLIKAARNGDLRRIVELLAKGASPNATDKKGISAIEHAVTRKQWGAVNSLLEHGAAIPEKDLGPRFIEAVIIVNASDGNAEIVRKYINDSRIDLQRVGNEAMLLASEIGATSIVELLLRTGVKPENPKISLSDLEQGSDAPCSLGGPLLAAAEHGHEKIVEFLLDSGMDIDFHAAAAVVYPGSDQKQADGLFHWEFMKFSHGMNALACAVRSNHVGVVSLLISRGADVNQTVVARNAGGLGNILSIGLYADITVSYPPTRQFLTTPLAIARRLGHSDIEKVLVAAGAGSK